MIFNNSNNDDNGDNDINRIINNGIIDNDDVIIDVTGSWYYHYFMINLIEFCCFAYLTGWIIDATIGNSKCSFFFRH
jgi:hypothetical protein